MPLFFPALAVWCILIEQIANHDDDDGDDNTLNSCMPLLGEGGIESHVCTWRTTIENSRVAKKRELSNYAGQYNSKNFDFASLRSDKRSIGENI